MCLFVTFQGANTVHIMKTRGLETSLSVSALLVGVASCDDLHDGFLKAMKAARAAA